VQLDPLNSANTDYYMGALRDITDDAEMGVFSTILAQKIIALEVFANRLEAQLIKLRGPNGIIQSDNYDPVEKTGWLIDYMGNAYFNNATIANGLFFEGEIKTGPLQLLNDTPIAHEYTFWPGATYDDINRYCNNKPINGIYNNLQIQRLYTTSTSETHNENMSYLTDTTSIAFVLLSTGASLPIAIVRKIVGTIVIPTFSLFGGGLDLITEPISEFSNILTLGYKLQFRYLSGGKTFKLLDLPTAPPEDMNIVWNDDGYLRVGH